MKIYFDTLTPNQSNLSEFETNGKEDWWLVSKGSVMKRELENMQINFHSLDTLDEPGIYYIDVNGDPNWWTGWCLNGPSHILEKVPEAVCQLVRARKLRLIINADKEGGPMVYDNGSGPSLDGFATTNKFMRQRNLPPYSVLILQGNSKIEDDYDKWLQTNQEQKLFEVQYSNHFGHIFFDDKMPKDVCLMNALLNKECKDFNSLNRVYRPHRGAHLYTLATENLLQYGIVSCNQVGDSCSVARELANTDDVKFNQVMKSNFPIYIDGNWAQENAAWNYNPSLYQNTRFTVITETIFNANTAFVTEKIFKPLALGHPFILIAGSGTLKALENMGFKCNFYNFGTEYDAIEDPVQRFAVIHDKIKEFISLDNDTKIKMMGAAMDDVIFNFNHIRENNFYHDAISKSIKNSMEYFNEKVW